MTKHFKLFSLLVIALLIISCGENKKDTNFTLKGHVTGLKKGTVYLQKQQDSLMVTLDSLAINGNSEFDINLHKVFDFHRFFNIHLENSAQL